MRSGNTPCGSSSAHRPPGCAHRVVQILHRLRPRVRAGARLLPAHVRPFCLVHRPSRGDPRWYDTATRCAAPAHRILVSRDAWFTGNRADGWRHVMTTTEMATFDDAKLEAFVGQAVTDMGAAISGLLLHIGDRLGLYKAMAGAGPITSDD